MNDHFLELLPILNLTHLWCFYIGNIGQIHILNASLNRLSLCSICCRRPLTIHDLISANVSMAVEDLLLVTRLKLSRCLARLLLTLQHPMLSNKVICGSELPSVVFNGEIKLRLYVNDGHLLMRSRPRERPLSECIWPQQTPNLWRHGVKGYKLQTSLKLLTALCSSGLFFNPFSWYP